MKTYWKIILIIVDVITFLLGGQLLIVGLLNNFYFKDYGDVEIGSFMITLGLLIHYWRKNYFKMINKETEQIG